MGRAGELAQHLQDVRDRVTAAALAHGRDPESIVLVAVSKTRPASDVRAAYAAGQRDFGENYAQELSAKRDELRDLPDLRWHFIGALQSNKAKLVTPCTLVHAIDRDSVAEAISKRAVAAGVVQDVLVEVNVGAEDSKAGVPEAQLPPLLDRLSTLPGIRVRGLMCIPPPVESTETQRAYFRRLSGLRRAPSDLLSMGMSDDFELAIAEGATHVRVGTAIFGART